MKLPANIPTALIFMFLFSLQVPLRLAAPLSHDKLFPKSVIPLIHYERIDNGRLATRHSNLNSNKDFASPPLLSLSVPPPSRLQKRENAWWDAATAAKLSQPKRGISGARHPELQPRSTRPGRYPRHLKHLFAHSYHHSSSGGRGVIDSDFDFDRNSFPIKRRLSETADDDLNPNLDLFGSGLGGGGVNLLKTITIEPTLSINSTSIQRLDPPAPGPGAGSYFAAMNMGGAAPRPRESPGGKKEVSWMGGGE